jgi:hypothetical protein
MEYAPSSLAPPRHFCHSREGWAKEVKKEKLKTKNKLLKRNNFFIVLNF